MTLESKPKTRFFFFAVFNVLLTTPILDTILGKVQVHTKKFIQFPVAIAKGIHLFSSRTQKLSPYTPIVLGW